MINLRQTLRSALTKKLIRSTSIYSGANFLNQALPFFLLPILTRFLSTSDYGILATFMATVGIVNVLASMGCVDAIIRGYFDRDKKGFDFPKLVFNAFFINLIVFLILILAVFFFGPFIGRKMLIPFRWLLLLPLIGFCGTIYGIPSSLFVIEQKPVHNSVFKLSNVLIELTLSIFFVVVLRLNWQGRILGITLSNILFLLIGIYLLLRANLLNFSLDFNYIKSILNYGLPVILHSLSFVVIGAVDRFFLNSMIGLSVTGLYSVGYSISMIVGFIVGAFNAAWVPILYEKLGHPTETMKIKLVKFTYLYFIMIVFFSLFIMLIAPNFLKLFVGKNFYGASKFIYWIVLGYAVHGMYVIVVNYIFYQKKTYLLSIIAVITIIANIIFNYVFIKLNGAIGAAQATFLTFFIRFLLVWYFSNKVYPMPWFSFRKTPNQHD